MIIRTPSALSLVLMLLLCCFAGCALMGPLSLILILQWPKVVSSDNELSAFQFPNYRAFYYTSLKSKLSEATSLGHCKIKIVSEIGPNRGSTLVALEAPLASLERVTTEGLIHAFSSILCRPQEVTSYFSRQRANSCTRTKQSQGNDVLLKVGHLHPSHPRCESQNAENLRKSCSTSKHEMSSTTIYGVDWDRHQQVIETRPPFYISASNAMISKSGLVWLQCGLIGLFSSCGAVRSVKEALSLKKLSKLCTGRTASLCKLPRYSSVISIAQLDDTQIGQFMLESLPRLIHNYGMIHQNPGMMIHFGFSSKHVNSSVFMESVRDLTAFRVLKWLGLDSRVITGDISTQIAIIPREGACQDPLYNAYEIKSSRKFLADKAWTDCSDCDRVFRRMGIVVDKTSKLSIIIQRDLSAKYSQNRFDRSRRWSNRDVDAVKRAAVAGLLAVSGSGIAMPNSNFVIFSDSDTLLMECIPCQVRLFSVAYLVIGMHGAGLANIMFMPKGGDVVEIFSEFHMDVRHFPLVGIFPRLSVVAHLNHFSMVVPQQLNLTLPQSSAIDEVYVKDQLISFYHKKMNKK